MSLRAVVFALLIALWLFACHPRTPTRRRRSGNFRRGPGPSARSAPNAKVVVSSEGQGTLRTLTTNDAGVFTAPALIPGSGYQVTVTAAGFAAAEVKSIEVLVGQNVDLKIALTVAAANTQVEVAAIAPLVEDTKTDSRR